MKDVVHAGELLNGIRYAAWCTVLCDMQLLESVCTYASGAG